jgi:hypothetical protein
MPALLNRLNDVFRLLRYCTANVIVASRCVVSETLSGVTSLNHSARLLEPASGETLAPDSASVPLPNT